MKSSTTTTNTIEDHGFVPADLIFKVNPPTDNFVSGNRTANRRTSFSTKHRPNVQDQDIYYPMEDLKIPKTNVSKSYPENSKPFSINSKLQSFNISKYLKKFDGDSVKFLLMCLSWYTSSSVTNNIGKQILDNFKYPISLTWIQFGIVSAFCFLASFLSKKPTITYPSKHVLMTCMPLCLFQIVGHIFSSIAMNKMPVSLVHTIKALSPLFTVLAYRIIWSIKYSTQVYLALIPLTIGVGMACINKVTWSYVGIICALGSCLVYVAQSITTKKLLFKNDHAHDKTSTQLDKLNILFYSSFLAFILMFPAWFIYEGYTFFMPSDAPSYSSSWLIMQFLLNGGSQYVQTIISFSILAMTSAVTFTIASLFKRVFVILTAIFYFRQQVTTLQIFGIILTFIGLYLYDNAKREVKQLDQIAQLKQSSPPLLPTNVNEPTKFELDNMSNNPSLSHRKHNPTL
ncbi:TPT-domain-containing protein [Conidiobolus coronatus NRRL 28638]|uniref:TPT-domain-containing protein n=1 Tax=Conidiobolus coronatus (strain ATCC 28846 / CBS 209.66 / NRRL 28638) TaxID=796925 RepID=A0A137NT47_CONC2|nr:TPT-domain-containing protein [Conidiobolus coronatus NRRL 28638]|eukprot:KXN65892.1 TPT-domain-containing protein [Conidiobolus coronatus NRRL 28638]